MRKLTPRLPILSLIAVLGLATPALANTVKTGVIAKESPWETAYYVRDSGKAGPTVLIVGGMHGNEPAGAMAADQIRHWPLIAGRMIVVPRANMTGLKARKRFIPNNKEALQDLNRNFPKAKEPKGSPARGKIAKGIWALIQKEKVDWVFDLHEGFDFHKKNNKSVGSSVICFPTKEGKEVATLLVETINKSIKKESRHFDLLKMPVDGSLARAAGKHLGLHAMIVETTSKTLNLTVRVRQHRIMMQRALAKIGVIGPKVTRNTMTDLASKAIKVALYDSTGNVGRGVQNVIKELSKLKKDVEITRVCATDIKNGCLDQFDTVIFSGGRGSKQASALGKSGRSKAKAFVKNGGGYIGICAGSYLACTNYKWSLGLIDAKTKSSKWRRGIGYVKIQLSDTGLGLLGDQKEPVNVVYANGPIIGPSNDDTIPDYEVLAWFRTELSENETPKGLMVDSPAIVRGRFGKGTVICFSPHPEATKGLEGFISKALKAVQKK
ncbi:MAG: succinylglutamate desuccinylase/aspartoacylase family protein [Planctomycetota bacterium]|nr:succinylglutamate desuccinylase/aspartoacylase family protein [Planctomycetota bacterium]